MYVKMSEPNTKLCLGFERLLMYSFSPMFLTHQVEKGFSVYPFMPETTTPWMKSFCAKKNRRMGGTSISAEAAMSK